MEVHSWRTLALLSGKKGGVLFPLRGRSHAPGIWGPLETGGRQGKDQACSLPLTWASAGQLHSWASTDPWNLGPRSQRPAAPALRTLPSHLGEAPFHRVTKLDMWSAPHNSQAKRAEQARPSSAASCLKGFKPRYPGLPIPSIYLTSIAPLRASWSQHFII